MIVATLLARSIARPVSRVARASRRLADGHEPDPLPLAGPRELRGLAESFNTMAGQLARARDAERSFLLSVSHELKTPLTAIRGYSEALDEGVLTPERAVKVIRTEAARLERLIADILNLARLDGQRFDIHPDAVDLAEIARESAARHAARARDLGVEIRLEQETARPRLGGSRPSAPGRLESRRERVAVHAARRDGDADDDRRRAHREGHRPGNCAGRDPARLRSLLPLSTLQRPPSCRDRSGAVDRARARTGDGWRRARRCVADGTAFTISLPSRKAAERVDALHAFTQS